jgi:ABC-2 type transport system permease protein
MNKIWLITKREYLSRVKSKTFLLTTILAPLSIVLLMVIVAFLMSKGSDDKREFVILDESGILNRELKSSKNISFEFSGKSLEELKKDYEAGEIDGIIEIPAIDDPTKREISVNLHSDIQLALDESMIVENRIEDKIRSYKIDQFGLDREKLDGLRTSITIEPKPILDKDKKVSSLTTVISTGLGAVLSYVLFLLMLIYGAQVMRSVMEEKINRVVEVLISSVKPFELMMGKILGVGSVGLTQVGIWLILLPVLATVSSFFFNVDPTDIGGMTSASGVDIQAAVSEEQNKFILALNELSLINWWKIIPLTLLYFFGGYFAYAALFAAVGSAVGEDVNEAQSLTLPVMLPMILAIYVAMSAISAPNSSIAVWFSMIPLFSPVVMPVRLPMDPPTWQIIVSVVLMILSVFFLVWLAARIYRVGILMYGKKASFKELGKWLFYRG